MNSDSKARMLGLFGLAIFAVWLTSGLASNFYLCLSSLSWPRVPATITSSVINTGVSNVGRYWEPAVEYDYQVNGHVYHASMVRYMMPLFYRQDEAASIQSEFPRNAQTMVACDPRNPAHTVLQPGVPAGMWWQALIPVFFWSLIGYIFYEIRHPRRRVLLGEYPQPAEE